MVDLSWSFESMLSRWLKYGLLSVGLMAGSAMILPMITNAQGNQDSNFQLSCNNINSDGVRISAECKNRNGQTRLTQIRLRGIENINGTLTQLGCVDERSPVSTFHKTCTNIFIRGNTMSAVCLKRNNARNRTTAIILRGIENIDGRLRYTGRC